MTENFAKGAASGLLTTFICHMIFGFDLSTVVTVIVLIAGIDMAVETVAFFVKIGRR